MLYRFEVENFFSIRDRQVIDLTVDGKVIDLEGRFAPIYSGAELRAPKVVALFGANASGKTTVLRALSFVFRFIRESVQYPGDGFVGCERFNDSHSASRPIIFAVEFGGPMDLSPNIRDKVAVGDAVLSGSYRYELELDVFDGLIRRVARETLRQRPQGNGKWQRVFERVADMPLKVARSFGLSGYAHLEKTLAANHSVIASFAKFQHPVAMLFAQWARNVAFHIDPVHFGRDEEVIDFLKGQPVLLSNLSAELSRIDTGVEGASFRLTPNGPLLMFKHTGLDVEMPWMLESHGTRAFIRLYPFLSSALDQGGIAVIDELDAAIHPLLLPELVRWFRDSRERNKRNAQLWLTCHSASLLDDLTKEEIVICEKDRQGRTSVHSLMDVKVRRDDNHYKKYLSGVYGGVPYLG